MHWRDFALLRFCRSATLEWSTHNTMLISTLITNVGKCNPETKNIEDGAAFDMEIKQRFCVGLAATHNGCQHKKERLKLQIGAVQDSTQHQHDHGLIRTAATFDVCA